MILRGNRTNFKTNLNFLTTCYDRANQIVPKEYQNLPTGFYTTFVVDSADEVYEIAKKENFEVVKIPTDTIYGQQRLLL